MNRVARCEVWVLVLAMFCLGLAGCDSRNGVTAVPRYRQFFPSGDGLRDVTSPLARERGVTFHAIERESDTLGYLATQRVTARSGVFTVNVIMGSDFHVLHAYASQYTGGRGREICSRRFEQQFRGKTPGDPIRIGKDIDAVSGATSSSVAMTDSVRRIVSLTNAELSR